MRNNKRIKKIFVVILLFFAVFCSVYVYAKFDGIQEYTVHSFYVREYLDENVEYKNRYILDSDLDCYRGSDVYSYDQYLDICNVLEVNSVYQDSTCNYFVYLNYATHSWYDFVKIKRYKETADCIEFCYSTSGGGSMSEGSGFAVVIPTHMGVGTKCNSIER